MKSLFLLLAFAPFVALAAPDAAALVGLQEDVAALRDEVRKLRAEVEELREAAEKSRTAAAKTPAASPEVAALAAKLAAVDEAHTQARKAEVAELNAKIAALAKSQGDRARPTTPVAPDAPVKPVSPKPPMAPPEIPADMPKSGVRYLVKSGDSVPKIAKAHGSKPAWILAANRLKSNADLKSGVQIFVPQPEGAPAPAAAE